MGSQENRNRKKWQDVSGQKASKAENDFFQNFKKEFEKSPYRITQRPSDFKDIYLDVQLPKQIQDNVYIPNEPIKTHGIRPDYAIVSENTGKKLFVEVKRQDGWVEGGKRSDGRGNAHERACKYFTPGLLEILYKESGITSPHLPFWIVLQGNITRDPCRVRELSLWFKNYESHFFLWHDTSDPTYLFEHFFSRLAPLLD